METGGCLWLNEIFEAFGHCQVESISPLEVFTLTKSPRPTPGVLLS